MFINMPRYLVTLIILDVFPMTESLSGELLCLINNVLKPRLTRSLTTSTICESPTKVIFKISNSWHGVSSKLKEC